MLKGLRSTLSNSATAVSGERSRPNSGEYQAISVGDEASPDADIVVANDRRHKGGVYLSFWALGAGILLTWNALICTIPLMASFFPSDSAIKPSLASYVSTTYCFGNLFFLGAAQRQVGKVSVSKRLHWALLLSLVTSLVLTFPLLPLILPRLSSTLLFPALLLITLTFSLATAYFQSAVFALASLWGSTEMLAVMSGQGGIAVLVSLTQLLLAVLSAKSSAETEDPGASKLAGVGLWALGSLGLVLCLFAHRRLTSHPEYHNVLAPVALRSNIDIVGEESLLRSQQAESVTKRVFRKNLVLEAAVAWVFLVTLSVFPPITTTILSTQYPTPRLLQPDVFIPLHFLLFNIGDYVGRTYLPFIPALLVKSPNRVLALSLARTLLIPLFLACNVTPRPASSVAFFNSDLIYFLIILVFSMTNGWIGSLCMILASSPALNPKIEEEEKDVAGTLAAFCLVAGLAAGSASSFGVSWAITHL